MKAGLTLKDFLTLGQLKRNCQLMHMHVLLEAHMPVSCFNNLNQLHPQDKFAMARQHTKSLIQQPNTVNNVTMPCMKAVFLFLSKSLVCWNKRWIVLENY